MRGVSKDSSSSGSQQSLSSSSTMPGSGSPRTPTSKAPTRERTWSSPSAAAMSVRSSPARNASFDETPAEIHEYIVDLLSPVLSPGSAQFADRQRFDDSEHEDCEDICEEKFSRAAETRRLRKSVTSNVGTRSSSGVVPTIGNSDLWARRHAALASESGYQSGYHKLFGELGA
eukprot:TRINITY_DN4623_c0_g1_i1.p1 TRINITY_DN4623_c0_g1~~TRINITY_DN4623_c0_g1_i1.p1  ORF type:complete len:173 (-),score=30.62 TRINITY_DN4623_c0_g1_i1:121-639(-)